MTEEAIVSSPPGSDPNAIVGHKTLSDGKGGHWHEPLTRREADQIWEAVEVARKKRETDMPDEQSALNAMFNAWTRLKDFGWKESMYAPCGADIEVIEAGSTGIHKASRDEQRRFWVHAEGDMWPSTPVLFRREATPPPPVGTVESVTTGGEVQNK